MVRISNMCHVAFPNCFNKKEIPSCLCPVRLKVIETDIIQSKVTQKGVRDSQRKWKDPSSSWLHLLNEDMVCITWLLLFQQAFNILANS